MSANRMLSEEMLSDETLSDPADEAFPHKDIVDVIQDFFDADINAYLEQHGGAAEAVEVNGDELVIRMMGKCRSCLSMSETVDGVILTKVKSVFPFIERVTVTEEVSDEVYEQALSLFTHI